MNKNMYKQNNFSQIVFSYLILQFNDIFLVPGQCTVLKARWMKGEAILMQIVSTLSPVIHIRTHHLQLNRHPAWGDQYSVPQSKQRLQTATLKWDLWQVDHESIKQDSHFVDNKYVSTNIHLLTLFLICITGHKTAIRIKDSPAIVGSITFRKIHISQTNENLAPEQVSAVYPMIWP